MSKIRTTIRRAGVVAAVVAAVALSATMPASAAATRSDGARTAQAAGLNCGMAFLDYRNTARTHAYIIHSCTGTGTVQYDLTCVGRDTTVSYGYRGGMSIRLPVSCSSPILGLAWTIK